MATIPFKSPIFMMPTHLSLSTSTTHFSASASSSSSSSFTVDYLTNSCGLSLKSAISTSQKLHLKENNIHKFDSFITLFQSHGFESANISKIIEKRPDLLNAYQVEENLKPKLEFLVESGFSGPLLHELIVRNPRVLSTSLSQRIEPSLDFLRSFIGSEERLKLAVKRNPRLLTNNLKATLQPNIGLFVKEGVPIDALTKFIVSQPSVMQSKVDRLVAALEMAKDVLNMRPTDPKFLLAVTRMASFDVSIWERKLQVFTSLGFSQQQALSIFKRKPECFSRSEEKLRSKLDFYFNTVKLEVDDIICYPVLLGLAIETRIQARHNVLKLLLLGLAIETRIQARHNVLKLLLSKKLLKKDTRIAYIFTRGEDEFLDKYVFRHLQQLPSLLEMYDNDKAVNKIGLEVVHTENLDRKAD